MKVVDWSSIVVAVVVLTVAVVANAQQAKNLSRIGLLTGSFWRHRLPQDLSSRVWLNWAMWKDRTSLLNGALQVDRWTTFPNSPPNSHASL